MSVVEYNLLNDKQVSASHAAKSNGSTGIEEKPYKRDIFKRVRTRELCVLTRQLATLLHAGMPLVPALSALAEQLQGNQLAEIIEEVRSRVNEGSTLADALARHRNVFSPLFVSMVAAGEASGTLEEVLLRLAEMLEGSVRLAGKIKSAIAYPAMMIVVAVAVVVFLLSFVVPSITQIFIEMNRALPWPTRLLISTSGFIRTYFILITIVICLVLFGIKAGCRTKEAKVFMDRFKLKLPLFGKLFLKLETSRLSRTLGILLVSGIPILDALEIAKGVIQNSFIAGVLGSVKDLVGRGETIANAMRKTGIFPPIVFHIISTGQASGNIETALLDIANMYDGEVDRYTKTLVSLLEPAILLVMGAVVGFIVLAILLPIFEINQVI